MTLIVWESACYSFFVGVFYNQMYENQISSYIYSSFV